MYLNAIFNCILYLFISTLLLCIRFRILNLSNIAIRQSLVFRSEVLTAYSIGCTFDRVLDRRFSFDKCLKREKRTIESRIEFEHTLFTERVYL